MKKILAVLLIAVLCAAAVVNGTVRSRQEPGVSYTGLASDTKPSAGVKPGDVFTETDTGRQWLYDGGDWVQKRPNVSAAADTATLDAPGEYKAIAVNGYEVVGFWVSLAGVSTTATLQWQGKLGSSTWMNVQAGWDSLRWVANHDTLFLATYASVYDSLRVKLLSEEGGTAALISTAVKKGY